LKTVAYLPLQEQQRMHQAYLLAKDAHGGQLRLSGEPYIVHPLEVAGIVASLHLDGDALCAALLHDVVEDTSLSPEELAEQFGETVANIVAGLTKFKDINFSGIVNSQVENYRRLFLAMDKDPRVIVIKLADRVHNMRTLEFMNVDKQIEIAGETRQIYAPLAGRCGIYSFKAELEDLCLRYLQPETYLRLTDMLAAKQDQMQELLASQIILFKEMLQEAEIAATVYGRVKHLYSIYRKMESKNIDLDEVYDLVALRIIAPDRTACYAALGIAHTVGVPYPGKLHDFISVPKNNGYQSLHTTIRVNDRENLEVQIRTPEMHDIAEKGIATHWVYKEEQKTDEATLKLLRWIREVIELGRDTEGMEYLEAIKSEVFDEEIRVFTPNLDIITLPRESTPIDFAYRIHTQVGHRCIGAKINGIIAPLDTELNNGDHVEILTTKQLGRGPSPGWLNFVRTRTARERIRSFLRQAHREEYLQRGEAALSRELRHLGFDTSKLLTPAIIAQQTRRLHKAQWEDVLVAVGFGEIIAGNLAKSLGDLWRRLEATEEPSEEDLLAEVLVEESKPFAGIVIDDLKGLVHRLARCCNPIPGCPIIGYTTRGRGVTIHRRNCPTLRFVEAERLIPTEWGENLLQGFVVSLVVHALNRPQLLAQLLMQISDAKIALHACKASSNKRNIATIHLDVEVNSLEQLGFLKERLRRVRDVYGVEEKEPKETEHVAIHL